MSTIFRPGIFECHNPEIAAARYLCLADDNNLRIFHLTALKAI